MKLSLPKNQVKRRGTLACTNKESNASVTCAEDPAADATYNYITMTEFKCVDSNCPSNTEFQINLSNTENPLVSPAGLDPFVITITSATGNDIFVSPASVDATPELEVGPLISLTITHQNTQYIKETTEYYYEFETSSDIP